MAGDVVPDDQINSSPPEDSDSLLINVYGVREGDSGPRVYSIPAGSPVAEIVRVFEVGSHSEISYGDDPQETIALVAGIATKIAEIIPSRPTLASASMLELRFRRQITEEELQRIEALFPDGKMMQAGLERYVTEWDGESPILAPLMKENLIQFWWD